MSTGTIWVIGAQGRLGSYIVGRLSAQHPGKVIKTDKEVDVSDIDALSKAAGIYRPNIVINCASLSDAAYCEENPTEAYKVNTLGARNVAVVACQQNAKIIQLSANDVFSGINDRPKNEFDLPTPNTVLGLSLLAGENFVRELNPRHLIIRSSWLYGIGNDYVSYVANKGKANESFYAPVDRISTPTSISAFYSCLELLLDSSEYGIIHVSDEGLCSRFDYAVTILSLLGYDPLLAKAQVYGAASKSKNAKSSTVLDNLMLKITGICSMPEWRADLRAYISAGKD